MVLPTQKGGLTILSHGFANPKEWNNHSPAGFYQPKSDEKLPESFEEGLRQVGKPPEGVVVDCGGE